MTQYVWTHKNKMVLSLLQILQGYAPFITATKDNRNGQTPPPSGPSKLVSKQMIKNLVTVTPPLSDRRAIYQQLDSSLSHCVKEQCIILSGYICTCIITEESTSRAAAIISAFVLFSRLIPTSVHTCRLNARKCAQSLVAYFYCITLYTPHCFVF